MPRPLPRWLDRLLDAIDATTHLPPEEVPLWVVVVADLSSRLLVSGALLVWFSAIAHVAGLAPDPLPSALRDPCVQRGYRVCEPDGTWVQPEKARHDGSMAPGQETFLTK